MKERERHMIVPLYTEYTEGELYKIQHTFFLKILSKIWIERKK